MKLRKVEKAQEAGYPTYWNYLKDHRKELGIIAAGVSLMLTSGCEENKTPAGDSTVNPAGIPKPPISAPANNDVRLDGEMAAPIPPASQIPPKDTPKIEGKIAAPASPQTTPVPLKPIDPPTLGGKPLSLELKGKMPAPKPLDKTRGREPMTLPQQEKK